MNGRLTVRKALYSVSSPFYLTAAYGRSYATAEAALCAWKEGKDFKIMGGPYCSIRDFEKMKSDNPCGIFIVFGSSEILKLY